MRIIKSIFTFTTVTLLFNFNAMAQRLTFSSELGYFNQDDNISTISHVWENYINAIDANAGTSFLWTDGSSDIHIELHKDGLLNTYNIRKLTDNIYEINTIAYYPDSAIKGGLINSIYKVCTVQTDDGWKLMNYLDATKHRYTSYNTDHIDFYIGNGVSLDKNKIKSSAKFAKRFIQEYNIENNNRITYIAANSIDECSAIIGLVYTPMRSHKSYAGRTIDNIILSTQLDHIHEVVHAIMLPLYPNAPQILHEGIATYYAGTAGQDYKTLKKVAIGFLEREHIDFSSNNFLEAPLSDDIPLSYVVGAAIVEYAIQNGGEGEVLRLFKATTYDQIFEFLNIANDQRTQFIHKLFIGK